MTQQVGAVPISMQTFFEYAGLECTVNQYLSLREG